MVKVAHAIAKGLPLPLYLPARGNAREPRKVAWPLPGSGRKFRDSPTGTSRWFPLQGFGILLRLVFGCINGDFCN